MADKKKKGLNPPSTINVNSQDLVDYVTDCFDAANDRLKGIHETMDILWAQYRCQDTDADVAGLKDWQARTFIPKATEAVGRGVTVIREALFRKQEYAVWQPVDDGDEKYIPAQKATVEFFLKRAKFEKKFLEAVHSAFAMVYGVLKLGWENTKETKVKLILEDEDGNKITPSLGRTKRTTGQLSIDVVHPKNFFTDAEHTYCIERQLMTWPQIMAHTRGPKPLFSAEAVRRMKESPSEYDQDDDELQDIKYSLGHEESSNKWIKQYVIYEFWGPAYDKEGNLVSDNARLYVANKNHLLNPHDIGNPWWTGKHPYHFLSPITIPFRKEGQAIHEPVMSLQKALNTMYRMRIDSLTLSLFKMLQVVPEWLEDPEDLMNYQPGDMIAIKAIAAANGRGAIFDAGVSDRTQGVHAELDFLDRGFDSGVHSVMSTASGPPIKRDVTATENSNALNTDMATMKDIARNIEPIMGEVIVHAKDIILQKHRDLDHPRFAAIAEVKAVGKELEGLSAAERLSWLTPEVDVKVRGLSAYLEQVQSIEGLVRLLENAAKNPEIRARINWTEFLEKLLEATNVPDAESLRLSPQMDQIFSQLENEKYLLNLLGGNLQMKQAIQQMMQPPMPQPGQLLETVGQVLINKGGMNPQIAGQFVQMVGNEAMNGQQQPVPAQAPAQLPA